MRTCLAHCEFSLLITFKHTVSPRTHLLSISFVYPFPWLSKIFSFLSYTAISNLINIIMIIISITIVTTSILKALLTKRKEKKKNCENSRKGDLQSGHKVYLTSFVAEHLWSHLCLEKTKPQWTLHFPGGIGLRPLTWKFHQFLGNYSIIIC